MNEHCPECGASLKKFWHRLTPGLVRALYKFARGIGQHGRNELNPSTEMPEGLRLTFNERSNFTKLRFFALVAKVRTNGQHTAGKWLLTKRGSDFLHGRMAIPKRVQTYRNEVIAHDPETITVHPFIRQAPWFEQTFDYDVADGEVFVRRQQPTLL
jgi:hypothetical protein